MARRLEWAARAPERIARGPAGARWCSPARAPLRTPPPARLLPAPSPKATAHEFECAKRFDCIGENFRAKEPRDAICARPGNSRRAHENFRRTVCANSLPRAAAAFERFELKYQRDLRPRVRTKPLLS